LCSIVQSLWPSARRGGFIVGMAVATGATGALGTVLGLIHTCGGLSQVDPSMQHVYFFQGLRESLNCVSFGLVFVVPTCICAAIGSLRLGRRLEDAAAKS
jgi:hypothetical protein